MFVISKAPTVTPIKLETGLRPNSAGIPYTVLLRIEAMGFPTFWLLLYSNYSRIRPLLPGLSPAARRCVGAEATRR